MQSLQTFGSTTIKSWHAPKILETIIKASIKSILHTLLVLANTPYPEAALCLIRCMPNVSSYAIIGSNISTPELTRLFPRPRIVPAAGKSFGSLEAAPRSRRRCTPCEMILAIYLFLACKLYGGRKSWSNKSIYSMVITAFASSLNNSGILKLGYQEQA
jgi:hypothetical protein